MGFELDEQTKNDLGIFDVSIGKSLYDLFDLCISYGGKKRLRKIMSEPSTDRHFLMNRSDTIAYFQSHSRSISHLDIDKNSLDFIEHYLNYHDQPTRKPNKFSAMEKGFMYRIKPNNDYYIIERGIDYTIELLNNIRDFFTGLDGTELPEYLHSTRVQMEAVFKEKEFTAVSGIKNLRKLKAVEIANFDYMFRYTHRYQIDYFVDLIYYLDVLTAMAKAADKYHLCYPELRPSSEQIIQAEGLFHPLLKNAVGNDLRMDAGTNMIFITGPNMSGKSTFLKSLGIAAYLSHIGFPVPAVTFKISILSGIYSTINLKDNIQLNYSHFYSEIKRIKDIAERLENKTDRLVIFDELFRGTNVKDAFEGSLAIISAFAHTKRSFFVISTHILEVAERLKEENIRFVYLETINKNGIPFYTYKIKEGVSNERLGMYIIQKEKVIDSINEANKRINESKKEI
ncbi:MutS-related protein [Limibacterium fermenti]|uniref:MutS-related protein n=1 Tax=Limibacterium fermenti TaxID=3229863 RepID=UPI000E7EA51B|nr:hypothetical protein [Porphyromonadaceae bacterium]HBX44555.1 hypothetical protein [Porphyromonadaceae bacterium]